MMHAPTLSVAGLLLLASAGSPRDGDGGWTDAETKQGVALAFRDDRVLAAREVRATADMAFSAEHVFSLVCDLTAYEGLIPGVEEATLIDGTSPGDYEVYLRYAPRFLVVAARDVVLRVRAGSETAGTLGCNWSEVADRLPEHSGSVRMPLLRGSWTIEPIDPARSRVVYQVAVKPGGHLPAWLVRRGALSTLPDVIAVVQQRLARSVTR